MEEGASATSSALRLSPRDPLAAIYCGIAAYARFVGQDYNEAMRRPARVSASAPISSAPTACSPPRPA
jgi:hypothetical protein